MAVTTDSKKKKRRAPAAKKGKRNFSWMAWCPLVLGILVTPLALRAASVLALSGPDGLTLLYPFVQILRSPAMKVPADLGISIAEWLMYLQFPFYGAVMSWQMHRRGLGVALGAVVCLHGAAIGLVYMLAHLHNPYLRIG